MARIPSRTVFIGNLDEKVSERVLYEILIQAGRVVDLYIPRDKETSRHKGYAFAEYESEEIAEYAVKLFSGLVCLHNRTLRFAISGQDKPSQKTNTSIAARPNCPPLPKQHHMDAQDDASTESAQTLGNNHRNSGNGHFASSVHHPASSRRLASQNNYNDNNYEYSRQVFGSMLNNARDRGGPQSIP